MQNRVDYTIAYREKDKGWQYIISRRDERGKWKQVASKQGFKKKSDAKPIAEKKLQEIKKEYTGICVDNNLTLEELHDVFVKEMKLYRSFNTIDGYTYAYHKIIELKDIKVRNITTNMLQIEINKAVESKIKSSSIETYVKKIKQIFKYYKDNFDGLYRLPTEGLRLNKKIPAQKRALTENESKFLVKDMKDSKFYGIALLCLLCGLRRGEALGVTWSDIDEVNTSISITKQWKRLEDGSWGFGDTKNKRHRIVPASKFLIKELVKLKKKYPTDIHNRVCPHTGLYLSQYMNDELKKYNITIHELRHTFTTNLISNGIDFKTAADLIGDSVEQVYKTYSHVNNDMLNKAKGVIENLF